MTVDQIAEQREHIDWMLRLKARDMDGISAANLAIRANLILAALEAQAARSNAQDQALRAIAEFRHPLGSSRTGSMAACQAIARSALMQDTTP